MIYQSFGSCVLEKLGNKRAPIRKVIIWIKKKKKKNIVKFSEKLFYLLISKQYSLWICSIQLPVTSAIFKIVNNI